MSTKEEIQLKTCPKLRDIMLLVSMNVSIQSIPNFHFNFLPMCTISFPASIFQQEYVEIRLLALSIHNR